MVELLIESSSYGFCPGDSVVLTSPLGFESYSWSNGVEDSNSITVAAGGNYSLLVTDLDGCGGISNIVSVIEITGDAPSIDIDGDLNLCDGSDIEMTASEAASWLWSTGEDTQTIVVSSSGTYSVSTVDICSNSSSSEQYAVVVYESPVGPPTLTASSTSVNGAASVSLEATSGENISWYDSEFGGNLLATGSSYETNILLESSVFWASSSHITSGELVAGGEIETQTGGQYHSNNNRWLEFDAYEDMVIRSITVYANGSYDRTFELIDNFDNVLASTTIFVEDGEFVLDLNFVVPAGNNYGMRTTTNDPQLWREGTDSELTYPYALGSIGEITQSTAGPSLSYYYFFYNWQVEPLPIVCESERVSIEVSVSSLSDLMSAAQFSPELSPNPALASSHVLISNFPSFPCNVFVTDISGRVIYTGSSNVISLNEINAGTYLISVLRQSDEFVLGVSRLIVQ
tara:strand:- start:4056 stop:5432 length:1377 start_codon:yes stop_codon:yes gene_type:complete